MAIKNIGRLATGDNVGDRWQAQATSTLNPILRALDVPRFTATSQPGADVTWSGRFIRVWSAGQPERLRVCLQNADGSYGWADVAMAPL